MELTFTVLKKKSCIFYSPFSVCFLLFPLLCIVIFLFFSQSFSGHVPNFLTFHLPNTCINYLSILLYFTEVLKKGSSGSFWCFIYKAVVCSHQGIEDCMLFQGAAPARHFTLSERWRMLHCDYFSCLILLLYLIFFFFKFKKSTRCLLSLYSGHINTVA